MLHDSNDDGAFFLYVRYQHCSLLNLLSVAYISLVRSIPIRSIICRRFSLLLALEMLGKRDRELEREEKCVCECECRPRMCSSTNFTFQLFSPSVACHSTVVERIFNNFFLLRDRLVALRKSATLASVMSLNLFDGTWLSESTVEIKSELKVPRRAVGGIIFIVTDSIFSWLMMLASLIHAREWRDNDENSKIEHVRREMTQKSLRYDPYGIMFHTLDGKAKRIRDSTRDSMN